MTRKTLNKEIGINFIVPSFDPPGNAFEDLLTRNYTNVRILCPAVKRKNLERFKFYGVKVSEGIIGGTTVGVFSNERAGICLLMGLNLNTGVSLVGAELEFSGIGELVN